MPPSKTLSKWDYRFLELADTVAGWTKDGSTGVGAILVSPDRTIVATGYNGLPRGLDDERPERQGRPEKYFWTEHAERNAIYDAARRGVSTRGCKLYITHPPCADCARGIIQAGIVGVCFRVPSADFMIRWIESAKKAAEMLEEADVDMEFIQLVEEVV